MMDAIAIQGVCCVNKTLALNGFSGYFSRFSVRTIDKGEYKEAEDNADCWMGIG